MERNRGVKQAAFWGLLVVGSFLVGALVISPLYSAIAGDRTDVRPTAAATAPTTAPPVTPAPAPRQRLAPPLVTTPPSPGPSGDAGSPEIKLGTPSEDGVQTPANPDQAGGVNSPDSTSSSTDRGAPSGDGSSAADDTRSTRDSVRSDDNDTGAAEPRRSTRRTRHGRRTRRAPDSTTDSSVDTRPARGTGDGGIQQPDSPDGR